MEVSDAAELDEFRDYLLLNLVVSPIKKVQDSKPNKTFMKNLRLTLSQYSNQPETKLLGWFCFIKERFLISLNVLSKLIILQMKIRSMQLNPLTNILYSKDSKFPTSDCFGVTAHIALTALSLFQLWTLKYADLLDTQLIKRILTKWITKSKLINNVIEEDKVLATGWEDTYYFRYQLKGAYDVSAG